MSIIDHYRPYQRRFHQDVQQAYKDGHRQILGMMATGCHAPGTQILMYDGSVKPVEWVGVGDQLMGPDSKPRNIVALHQGLDYLYKITPIKGESFIVNQGHILSLYRTPTERDDSRIADMPLAWYIAQSKTFKHVHKLYRCGVDFPSLSQNLPLDPYFLGVLIGDGCLGYGVRVNTPDPEIVEELYRQAAGHDIGVTKRIDPRSQADDYLLSVGQRGGKPNPISQKLRQLGLFGLKSGDKFMPKMYLAASYRERLELLAGLLDTDGSLGHNGFDYISKSSALAHSVVFLCRSLGFAAYCKPCTKGYSDSFAGTYYRVSISGDCDRIPSRVERKKAGPRRQKKNHLVTGFSVDPAGFGQYYGFEVDSDHRYLTADFVVHHNSGKTLTAAGMIERSRPRPYQPALFIVPRITLCEQAAQSFTKALAPQGLKVSILQAQHPAFDPAAPVQVASVQTLMRREIDFKPRLIIIDEAHIKFDYYQKLRGACPDVPWIGLTATPTSKGLADFYSTLVVGATTAELVAEGWLMPSRVYEPSVYSTEGVAVDRLTGEYNQAQLWAALQEQKEIHGDVVSNWLEHGEDRPTLCFPVNKLHSMEIVGRFMAADVQARHIQDTTSMEDRKKIFDQVRAGHVKVVSSVGCLTEGLDLTLISCLIFARPVKSVESHIQMFGRGLRPLMLEGTDGPAFDIAKRFTKVFDHGSNVLRLMHAEDYAPTELHSGKRGEKQQYEIEAERKGQQSKCKSCDAVKPRGVHTCPYCGFTPAPRETGVTVLDSQLVATNRQAVAQPTAEERRTFYQRLRGYASLQHYSPGWAAHAYKEKFGAWPEWHWRNLRELQPDEGTYRYVKHRQIKQLKSRRAA